MIMASVITVRRMVTRLRAFFALNDDRTVILMVVMLIYRDRRGQMRDGVLIPRRSRPGYEQGNQGKTQKGA